MPDGPGVTAESLVALHAVFVDKIDDQHSEERADTGYPVDEGDVDERFADGWVNVGGENGGVEERPVCQCELFCERE